MTGIKRVGGSVRTAVNVLQVCLLHDQWSWASILSQVSAAVLSRDRRKDLHVMLQPVLLRTSISVDQGVRW